MFCIPLVFLFASLASHQQDAPDLRLSPPKGTVSSSRPEAVPTRIRVSAEAAKANLISHPPPVYPKEAKKKGIQGRVKLRIIIDVGGTVYQAQAIDGNALLVPAALDVVRKWRYRPTLLNRDFVEVDTTVEIPFELKGKKTSKPQSASVE